MKFLLRVEQVTRIIKGIMDITIHIWITQILFVEANSFDSCKSTSTQIIFVS